MKLRVEDMEDRTRFRQLLEINYSDLVTFIFDNIGKRSALTSFFWLVCMAFLGAAIYARFLIAGHYPSGVINLHFLLGLVIFPLVSVPVHELIHLIPFYLSGARSIRAGMDLRQFLFYVTAHRFVAGPWQFVIIASLPFIVISAGLLIFLLFLPGIWRWSILLFLFVHATMCAGDFSMLNFYWMNRDKKIYTWDDADRKISYFYEKIDEGRGGERGAG